MKIVTMHGAKTNLSRIVEEARASREIVIALGKVPGSFFDPLQEEDLAAWGE